MSRGSDRWSTSQKKPTRTRPSIAIYADFGAPGPPGAAPRRTIMAVDIIQELDREQMAAVAAQRKIPDFAPGDTLQVNVKVKEGERTRVQAYEGVCIARSGGGV